MSGKSPGPDGPAAELRRRIAKRGPVGFDEFMAVALYHPDGGYYASHKSRTGKHGDFFTSVSVGPVFGKLLAAQFAEMREHLGRPGDFTLVEQGANDGQLMADILHAWTHPVPRIVMVEPLPQLRELQQQTLAPWADRVSHVAHESELPAFTGVFFANELLDAFPVKILARENGEWLERRVGYDTNSRKAIDTEEARGHGRHDHDTSRFVFVDAPMTDTALPLPAVPDNVPRFVTEVCPSLAPWMRTLSSKVARGWIMLIDYGHPTRILHDPARAAGTLAACRNHERRHDPLDAPGTQDLTVHVDFTAAARAAADAGLAIAGFTDQHHALAALAALAFPPIATAPLAPAAAKEMRALRHLLHPESMGTSFKFLALSKQTDTPLSAFRFARNPQSELFA